MRGAGAPALDLGAGRIGGRRWHDRTVLVCGFERAYGRQAVRDARVGRARNEAEKHGSAGERRWNGRQVLQLGAGRGAVGRGGGGAQAWIKVEGVASRWGRRTGKREWACVQWRCRR